MNAVGKLLSLLEVRLRALHPYQIRIRSKRDSTVHSALTATLVAVVALSCPWRVPVPMNIDSCEAFSDGSRFTIALALGQLSKFLNQGSLVNVHASFDGVFDCFGEELETCLSGPLVLDGLKLFARFASLFSRYHQVVQGLQR